MTEQISFDTISAAIRVPGRYIEFNTRNAVRGLPNNPQKMLLIAPQTDAAKQPALTPVQLFSDVDAAELFGAGSWAHRCVTQAFTNNPYLDLTVIGIADDLNTSARARGGIVLDGVASSTGLLTFTIGTEHYQLSVSTGATVADLASRAVDLINHSGNSQVIATATSNGIELIAVNAGEIGNEINITVNCTAADVVVSAKDMAEGAGNVDIQAALDVVAGKRYHVICSVFNDEANAKLLAEHVDRVSDATEKRGTIGVLGCNGTLDDAKAIAAKLNNGRITLAWYKNAFEASALIVAGYAAVIAGEEDPARPLNTLEIKGLSITPDADWPMWAEFNNALYSGVTPLQIVSNKVQIMRAVSTYTTNATGTDDPALLDITTIRTLDYVRDAVDQRIALRFPREKLSDKTPARVRSEILDVLNQCEQAEILEEVMANKDKLIVQRNASDPNRLDVVIPADVVNGLHVFAARIDLYL
ncbi:phage tail sheath C-terminal domain-containing protein [Neisseriaceae bacterium ESL0693]|nr:phage tail sheath C-terminal domain-containing protein [Neisseriaceae bacterium ESL0693]